MWIILTCILAAIHASGQTIQLHDTFTQFTPIFSSTASRGYLSIEFDTLKYAAVLYTDPPDSVIYVTQFSQRVAMGPSQVVILHDGCTGLCVFDVNVTSSVDGFKLYGYLVRNVQVNADNPFMIEMDASSTRFFGFDFKRFAEYESSTNVIQITPSGDMLVVVFNSKEKLYPFSGRSFNVTNRVFAFMVEFPENYAIVQVTVGNFLTKSVTAEILATSNSAKKPVDSGNASLYGSIGIASILFAAAIVLSICFIIFKHRMLRGNDPDPDIFRPKIEEVKLELDKIPTQKVEDREFSNEDSRCVICLDDYLKGETLRLLPCGHHFHQTCADEWLSSKPICPLCLQYLAYATDYRNTKNIDDEEGENSRIQIGEENIMEECKYDDDLPPQAVSLDLSSEIEQVRRDSNQWQKRDLESAHVEYHEA